MIKLIVFDIDGVITDGSIIVDVNGKEQKKINMKDIDAIYELKQRGFMIAAVTKEDTEIVSYFKRRFPWDFFYQGDAQKADTLKELASRAEIDIQELCYIGDGKYDVDSLSIAGLGICPADAIDSAQKAADITLQNTGGQGGLWELVGIMENYNSQELPENYFYQRLDEHSRLFKVMASDQKLISTVMNIALKVVERLQNGGQLFLCGNGGSAADAQHIATEFISKFLVERPGLNAEALTVNTSTLTAVSNDYSFERVFARQLQAKAKAGDMLIGLSTSGKSKNVLEALRYAKENGIVSVILMGDFVNPELPIICDYIVKVPSEITPRIQEAHTFIGHTIAEYVEHTMFEK